MMMDEYQKNIIDYIDFKKFAEDRLNKEVVNA